MATFGKTTIGAVSGTEGNGIVGAGGFVMNGEYGMATQMFWYVAGGTNAQKIRTAIYADNSNAPGSLLATSTDEQNVGSGQAAAWLPFTISLALSPNTKYWLGRWTQNLGVVGMTSFWDTAGASADFFKSGQTYTSPPGGTPPDPFPSTPTAESLLESIYVSYTPLAVPPNKVRYIYARRNK